MWYSIGYLTLMSRSLIKKSVINYTCKKQWIERRHFNHKLLLFPSYRHALNGKCSLPLLCAALPPFPLLILPSSLPSCLPSCYF